MRMICCDKSGGYTCSSCAKRGCKRGLKESGGGEEGSELYILRLQLF